MKRVLVNNNSDSLILFFTGWGCDESEFQHLKSQSDVLILYDYCDLNLNFDFSVYKTINLLAFSAGVFVASVFDLSFISGKKIAMSGNPYLFDEYFGLPQDIQDLLYNITEENADDFAKNYLVKTKAELAVFHHSKRTLASCKAEFECLKNLYKLKKQNINNVYDFAIFGDDDKIFNLTAQKEFYKNKIYIMKQARHNPFFKISSYDQLFNFCKHL